MQPKLADQHPTGRTLALACGALVRELRAVTASWNTDFLDVHYLPAPLHNRPDEIVPALQAAINERLSDNHDRILLGYADCGTGGLLDVAMDNWRRDGLAVERLPGSHCYEFFAGATDFAELHAAELGTFFLTDYLARHFDQIIWRTFKLDRHPELIEMMFGNYRRVVYLAQTDDPDQREELTERARSAADLLGLGFEVRATGLAPFHDALTSILNPTPVTLHGIER